MVKLDKITTACRQPVRKIVWRPWWSGQFGERKKNFFIPNRQEMVRRGEAIVVVKTDKIKENISRWGPWHHRSSRPGHWEWKIKTTLGAVAKPEGTTTDNVAADERTSVNDYELLNFNYRPGKAGSFFVVNCDLNASYWPGCDMWLTRGQAM